MGDFQEQPAADAQKQSSPEQELNLDTFSRVGNLVKNCDEPVKDAKDKAICEIAKSKDITKIVRLSKFAEELGEKFLSKLSSDEKFQTKDPHKILEIFQNMTDWKKFVECFDKSVSYTILPKTANEGAMVIFKYADGKTEQYPLEIGSDFWRRFTSQFPKKPAESKKDENRGEQQEKKAMRDFENSMENHMKEILAKISHKESLEEKKERVESRINESNAMIQSSKGLASPEAAYTELRNSTRFLSEDMLRELSIPLSQTSRMISEAIVNPETGSIQLKNTEDFNKSGENAFQIIKKYYPKYPQDTPGDVLKDFHQIAKKFPTD